PSGLVARGGVVLAGTGPLLWLLARQYLRAGGEIAALLDTTPASNWTAALPHLPDFLASPYVGKGVMLLATIRRRVKGVRHVTELRAEGTATLTEIAYRVAGGAERRMAADLLLLHQGVAPNINLASAAGCKHAWDQRQLCWNAVV